MFRYLILAAAVLAVGLLWSRFQPVATLLVHAQGK